MRRNTASFRCIRALIIRFAVPLRLLLRLPLMILWKSPSKKGWHARDKQNHSPNTPFLDMNLDSPQYTGHVGG